MNNVVSEAVNYKEYGVLYSVWARTISMLMALLLSAVLLVLPQLVAADTHSLNHGFLSLGLLGICAGFVHGVGYVPNHRIWRWSFGPWVAWPAMLFMNWLLFFE